MQCNMNIIIKEMKPTAWQISISGSRLPITEETIHRESHINISIQPDLPSRASELDGSHLLPLIIIQQAED